MCTIARRSARRMLQSSPQVLRNAAVRVPFSRFGRLASQVFRGEEIISWRNVTVCIDPGELLGYYPYFVGDYSGAEIEKLIELCRNASLFIDVGANIGLISLAVAHACPHVQVIAFEPDADIAARFSKNLLLNPNLAERIRLVEAAVAAYDGVAQSQPSGDARNLGVGRLAIHAKQPGTRTVPAIRLDSFVEKTGRLPDVVKIDVEGFELDVLQGMRGILAAGFPKVMMIEVHAFYSTDPQLFNEQVHSALQRANYNLLYLTGERWEESPAPENWPSRIHVLAMAG